MKYPLLSKAAALIAVTVALVIGLETIGGIVNERQGRLRAAEQSVEDSSARQQTLLGPLLQRRCQEVWVETAGEGDQRRSQRETRDFVLTAWPSTLEVAAHAGIEPRYRGLFKLNSYLAKTVVVADWANLSSLHAQAQNPGGKVSCDEPTVAVALSDARGIQAASIQAGTERLSVQPGSLLKAQPQGFHARLSSRNDNTLAEPLRLEIALNLAGTRSLAWVPVGDETRVKLGSNWPHPSFSGRFLPVERQVQAEGFQAQWQVSALATTAQQTLDEPLHLCDLQEAASSGRYPSDIAKRTGCIDSFGVSFMDPVNGYVLSDRALKYGLLFIVLTFVGVGLVEVMRRVRVHPVQYLLVGCALTLFFLLLLSLSEHLAFGWAYLCASGACAALLTYYAHHILRGLKPGLVFGGAVGLLYGALYALLQMEQTAMVLGALLLFTVLSAVMVATRKIDWYAMVNPTGAPRAE